MDDLRNAFDMSDWAYYYSQNDSDILADFFNSLILYLHDHFVPIETFTSKNQHEPMG